MISPLNKSIAFQPIARLLNFAHLAKAYVAFNFKSQLEYRSAFIWQIVSMIVNDIFWLVYWVLFFHRFPVTGNWNQNDVITMWAIVAAGYGIAYGIAGNATFVATIIVKGQLDTWLLYPRAVLPHLLFGKMHVSAWGDALFGILAYLFLVHPSVHSFVLFLLLVLSVGILFVGFGVLVGSLGFFLGNAEGLSEQLRFALVTFSTYPPSIFESATKLILYTLIPAGFCSYIPVEALKNHSIEYVFLSFIGALLILAAGAAVFYLGLRRYESGNLMEMRG